jgi:RNA polymerase sigma-70 factor (ECF subfamily)
VAVSLTDTLEFETFYVNVAPRLHRALVLTVGDESLAAEATQEAMVRAYERWSRIADTKNPAGWAYRTALNWARTSHRRRNREGELLRRLERLKRTAAPPAGIDSIALERALAALDVGSRAVVVLRYYLQLSTVEIGETLEIPIGTVKSRLSRAVAELRRHLEGGS